MLVWALSPVCLSSLGVEFFAPDQPCKAVKCRRLEDATDSVGERGKGGRVKRERGAWAWEVGHHVRPSDMMSTEVRQGRIREKMCVCVCVCVKSSGC